MSNLEKVNNALMELEGIDFDELPEEIQEAVIYTHLTLMNLSTMLEETEREN